MTLTITALVLTAGAAADPPPHTVLLGVSSTHYSEPGCLSSVKAITYYRKAYTLSRNRMNLPGAVSRVWYQQCVSLRVRASAWRDKAKAARAALTEWHAYQYAWAGWLPDKWQRIGACETGYGKRPGNWQHNSGAYQGAFGFARSSWDAFVPSADPKAGPYPSEAYEATPRQQYEVALAIYRRYGLSGWGCRGA